MQIRALVPSLPPSERRVAEAAIADPGGVAAKTISELAAECRTSETTVIRFCRAVGLKGYPDLRIGLAAAAGMEDGSSAWAAAGSDIGPKDSLAEVVNKLGFADARAVEDTVAQLDLEVLKRAVDAVVGADAVDLYGVGASALVALDLQQKLHRIGRRVNTWADPDGALTSAALLGRGDLAIGISHTGATVHTVAALAEARDNGATTLAITNFPRSAIAEAADHVLTTAVRETTFRSGAMSSRIAALTVVDCLFVGVAQRNYSRTMRALERTYTAVRGQGGH
ncbi:MurR/RpiR family transcriptional regulator [Kitasatospora paranensis]|uniref:MurR/RpiR family transcriptional regulator n=1 Tax=Kitasatospora paranensis TaxID=258053 RepID=A0ABW2FZT2_9ACTN